MAKRLKFDQLLCIEDVAPNYVFDEKCLVFVAPDDDLDHAEKKIRCKIESIFEEFKKHKSAKIQRFYIGKTYVRQCKKRKLNSMDPETMIRKGIASRWGNHKKEEYGRDGMIVVAVITRSQVPLRKGSNNPVVSQEQYALALEQRLLHYYKITQGDTRLENTTFTSGGCDKQKSAGYALYITFSLEKVKEEEEGEMISDEQLQLHDVHVKHKFIKQETEESFTCSMETSPSSNYNYVDTRQITNNDISLEMEVEQHKQTEQQIIDNIQKILEKIEHREALEGMQYSKYFETISDDEFED